MVLFLDYRIVKGTDCLYYRKLGFLFLGKFFFLTVKMIYVPSEKYVNI